MDRSLYFLFSDSDLIPNLNSSNPEGSDEGEWGYGTQPDKPSKFKRDVFINYRGQEFIKDKLEPQGEPYENKGVDYKGKEDLSIVKIVEESKNYPMMELNYSDFVYLKDINRMPLNRMVALRRYAGPVGDNIFVQDKKKRVVQRPMCTSIGWVPFDEDSMFEMSYNEEWENNGENIADVAKEAFGLDVFGKLGGPKMKGMPMFEGFWGEGLNFQILKKLGITGGDLLQVVGNPDLITSAYIRSSPSDSGFEDGISTKLDFSFETTYQIKYIDGIDPSVIRLDIMSNLIRMGIQDSAFEYSTATADLGKEFANLLLAGKVIETVRKVLDIVKDVVLGIAKDAKKFIQKAANAVQEGVKTGDASNLGDLLINGFTQYFKARLGFIIAKYRVKIYGSLANMSGIPTGPWHLTVGNPFKPVISIGNMILTNAELELGNELLFDDGPSEIKVEYKVRSARNRGAQELENIINSASGRVHYLTSVSVLGKSSNLEEERKALIDSLGASSGSTVGTGNNSPGYSNTGKFAQDDETLERLNKITQAQAAEREREAIRKLNS